MQNRDYDRDNNREYDRNWRNGSDDWERDHPEHERGYDRNWRDRPAAFANRSDYGDYGRTGTTGQGYRQDWRGQRQDYEYGRGPGSRPYGENWQGRSGASGSIRGSDYEYGGQQYGRGRDYGNDGGYSGQGQYGGTGYGMPMTYTSAEYWLIPGPHTGKGPRGYQRGDERIREDVNERLTRHGQIDASDIDVRVENGEVTLTGTADDRQQKRMAEDIAEDVPGVRDVHNEIKMRGGIIDKVKDALNPGDRNTTDTGVTQRSTAGATGTTGTTASRTAGTTTGTTTNRRDVQ